MKNNINKNILLLLFIVAGAWVADLNAQVVVPFKQRTAAATPAQKIYNLKGDFQMIGNSNLTLQNYSDNGNNSNAMIYVDIDNDNSTLNSSSATLEFPAETGVNHDCSEIVYAGLYWTGRADNSGTAGYTITTGGRTLDKRQVKFKKAGDSYQTITADNTNIQYPTNSYGYMYAAYAEVTEYVKANGTGEYFVADMALREGRGGGIGYFGGWGLIVIYKNPKMKWRDITIFDGYAHIDHTGTLDVGETSYELPVSGFRTAQSGDIRIKMGLIAGEGDRSISGDFFQIRNQANTNWVNLSHSGNATNNFFNGSIPANNPRNPQRLNNLGLDIAMFEVNNPSNTIIGNDQTSTRFKYGTNRDTYIISTIALAVDAYVPDVRAFVSLLSPGQSGGVAPGDEIEYTLVLSNASNEQINGVAMDIPIPYTAEYISSSATYTAEMTTGDQPVYTATEGGNFIHWNVGTLPEPDNPNNPPPLATLTFKLKVTDNCDILVMDDCLPTVAVNGKISGVGANSGQNFSDLQFITGYTEASGGCESVPEYGPLSINIDVGDHCPNAESSPTLIDNQVILFCNDEPVENVYNKVKLQYPAGTRFYDKVVYTTSGNGVVLVTPDANATEYTSTNDFPVPTDTPATYHAVPYGSSTCAWSFTIVKGECANYWVGTNSTDWGTASNWSRNKVPESGKDVEFATTANNNNNPALNDLHVPANEPKVIGNLINASDKDLVVIPASFLIINGTVTDGNADAGTIIVQADPADLQPAGTLIFKTTSGNGNVGATAQFYNRAYQCTDCGTYNQSWQYFGIPVQSTVSFPTGDVAGDETVNQWKENVDGNKWETAAFPMTAFKGYEITNSSTSKPAGVYSFAGTLNVGDATVALTRTADVNYPGVNLVGNSYTAAIPISAEAITLPTGVGQTVYLFNTGTRDEWRKLNGTILTGGHKSGQYLAVPVNLGGQNDFPDRIPSTHAFMVLAEEGFTSGNLTVNYDKLVVNTKVKLGDGTTEIVTRSAESNPVVIPGGTPLPSLTMDVIGSQSADRVWIFSKSGATHGFDNGWDGRKIEEIDIVQLYVQGTDGSKQQVATTPGLDNVTLGFEAVTDGEYRMEFALSEQLSGREIFLHDIVTGDKVRIGDNASYTFTAKQGVYTGRFRLASSGDTFGAENEEALITVQSNVDGSIVINNASKNDCTVYISDTSGKLKHRIDVKTESRIAMEIANGIYVVRIQNAAVNDVRKVIVK